MGGDVLVRGSDHDYGVQCIPAFVFSSAQPIFFTVHYYVGEEPNGTSRGALFQDPLYKVAIVKPHRKRIHMVSVKTRSNGFMELAACLFEVEFTRLVE